MKTLQIGLEWFPERAGGLNRVYYDCMRYLPQVGIDICGLVAGSPKVSQDTNGRVQAFASANISLLQRWHRVRQAVHRMFSEQEYSLVVSHFALYTFPILNQLRQHPLITHFHGPWALESDVEGNRIIAIRLKKVLEQITYQRATNFIVLSQAFRDILHREYHIPLELIDIIPGGVDTNRFDINVSLAEARTKLDWPQDRLIMLCVRRLAKRMGLENLIAAIDKVRKYYPDILLYIAGKGALAQTLQAQIESLGLTEHICLLGYIPDEQLPLAYRAANFSVVPTVALEGFGLIVIESLATGTPVLGTPVGGISEILQPFSEDLLFEGCSIEQLTQGILEVLSSKRLLPSSQACQTYVQTNYAWPVIAKQIKSVYEKALS